MSTYDLLQSLFSNIPQDSRNISYLGFLLLITASVLLSVCCSYLYLHFYDKNSTGSKIHRAFPLMGPAITCIFLTVQFSLPLSLGLLGALSIVRFRTPIKEPEEIGFILLLIALALSVATFNLSFAVILLLVAFLALSLLQKFNGFGTRDKGTTLVHIETALDNNNVAQKADVLLEELSLKGHKAKVVSLNQEGKQAFITLRMQNKQARLTPLFDSIAQDDPTTKISVHEV